MPFHSVARRFGDPCGGAWGACRDLACRIRDIGGRCECGGEHEWFKRRKTEVNARSGSRSILRAAAAATTLLIGTAGGALAFDVLTDEERAERQAHLEAAAASESDNETLTIHDGVFTEEQALDGRAVYARECVSCHGNTLRGTNAGPPIVAHVLDDKYDQMPLSAYYSYMQTTMPQARPGSLSSQAYADILAFVLSVHGAEPGDTRLTADLDQLDRIIITSQSD